MKYSLSKSQIFDLCLYLIDKKGIEDEYLVKLIETSNNWDYELVVLSYFYSQVLEKRDKLNYDNSETIIDKFYYLQNEMSLSINELKEDFIEYLFNYLRDKTDSLEDHLILIQDKFNTRYE